MVLRNLLGPAAIKKHTYIPLDVGKPLGLGLGSSARIVGGSLLYERHEADTRFFMQATELIQNTRGSVTGVEVLRNSEGQIVANLEIVGPYGDLDAFNKAAGLSLYAFKTSDEYISSHIERPTIFQNLTVAHVPRGTRLPKSPMTPEAIMPFDLGLTAYTQAVGYLDGDRFRGTFEIDYQLKFIGLPQGVPVPDKTALYCEGIFDIAFK